MSDSCRKNPGGKRADSAHAVDGATRSTYQQVSSGVNKLQADLGAAANEAGDQAQQTYDDLLHRDGRSWRRH